MSDALSARTEVLKREFDAAFARPASAESAVTERFLFLRLGDQPFALPMSGGSARVTSLMVDRVIVRLPSHVGEFLGLAGVRGEIVPVFDLGRFVGRSGAGSRRWLAVVQLPEPAAFAFDEMDGLMEVPVGEILAAAEAREGTPNVARLVRRGGEVVPGLDLDAIAAVIRRSARQARPLESGTAR